jgi:K+-transporting ATPase c subunit
MKIQLSGSGLAPEIADNEQAMQQRVASTTGAIEYVSESKVTDDVKVLKVVYVIK